MKTSRTCCVYCRVSSENERQNVERQISDLSNYASNNNFNILNFYTEKISGTKKIDDRRVLKECIDYCISQSVDSLLLNSLDRLGRNMIDVLSTLELLHKNKINVFVQQLQLNTLNEDKSINTCANILVSFMAQMASIEKDNIKFRLNSGRQNYIKNGGKLGRSKGSVKTTEQKKVEYSEAISLLKKGYSVRNIAKITGRGVASIQRIKTEFEI